MKFVIVRCFCLSYVTVGESVFVPILQMSLLLVACCLPLLNYYTLIRHCKIYEGFKLVFFSIYSK